MLNRKKPYGEVCGPAPYKYLQDGKFFNHHGLEVDEKGVQLETVDVPRETLDPRTKLTKEFTAMKVPEIKQFLDASGIKYAPNTAKPDLVSMLVDEEMLNVAS
ncbi:MAG: hypothetical protein OES84_00090 [Kiritimatiellaceae bacterium]|nr:hypothetical protein [Kiritimatiellaceae bacterium]